MTKTLPASEALRVLVEYRESIMPRHILSSIGVEHTRLVSGNTIDDLRNTCTAAMLDVVDNLCRLSGTNDTEGYIITLPIHLQVFLFERLHYFEAALRQLGEEEYLFPVQFEQFLRQGLIETYDYRHSHRLFD